MMWNFYHIGGERRRIVLDQPVFGQRFDIASEQQAPTAKTDAQHHRVVVVTKLGEIGFVRRWIRVELLDAGAGKRGHSVGKGVNFHALGARQVEQWRKLPRAVPAPPQAANTQ